MNEACSNVRDDAASKARLQAFNATQWLARLANSYRAHDGELELRWDNDGGRIVTPELAPGLTLGLSLSTLLLQFDESGKPSPHPINLDDKSSTELEAWILVELLHRGVDRDVFSKTLPYETADLMSGEEPKYAAGELADELTKLNDAFRGAADILLSARRKLDASDDGLTSGSDGLPDLVFWPQRMEIGFLVEDDGGPADQRVRLGFAAGGANGDASRFFIESAAQRLTKQSLSQAEAEKMSAGEVVDYLVAHVGARPRSSKD